MILTKNIIKAIEIIAHDCGAINRNETIENHLKAIAEYFEYSNEEDFVVAEKFLSGLSEEDFDNFCIGDWAIAEMEDSPEFIADDLVEKIWSFIHFS